jgi:hypothetical protein
MLTRSDLFVFRVLSRLFWERIGAMRRLAPAVTVVAVAAAAVAMAMFGPSVVQRSSTVGAQQSSDTAVQLYRGWNNVRYEGIVLPTEQALGDAADAVSVVWRLDAPSQTWLAWSRALPASLLTLPTLGPGGIYFVLSSEERVWHQPLAPPSVAPLAPPVTSPIADPPADPAPSLGLWEVRFTRTTVLFALEEVVVFDANGEGTVSTLGGEPSAVTIATGSVASIGTILEANGFFGAGPLNTRSGCTSCFRYAIEIRDPAGSTVTLLTDGAGASGAQRTLVDQLTSVLLGVLP